MCDEVFGQQNYAATFIWTKTSTPPSLATKTRKTIEYVFAYEKNWAPTKYYGALLDGADVPLLNTTNAKATLQFPKGTIYIGFIDDGTLDPGVHGRLELHDMIYVKSGVNDNEVRILGNFKWA